MFKLIIFDYDGLIVNSEQVTYGALKTLLRRYNHTLAWEYYVRHIGTPVRDALQNFYRDYPMNVSFEEFVKERNRIVSEYVTNKLRPMPGLISLLNYLKKNNASLVIATSGKRTYVEAGLHKFNIAHYFQTVVCIEDVKRGKPHPDLLMEVLKRTGFKNSEAVILEDSPHGIEAASRAGIFSIAIPIKRVDYNKFIKADIIVDSLRNVKKLLGLLIK